MSEPREKVEAYSFGLQADQAAGSLRIGWRKIRVAVTQYSWSGYTIVVNRSVARRLRTGQAGKLEYQGSSYQVTCLDSRKIDGGKSEVHLELDASATKLPGFNTKKRYVAGASVNLNQRDPILSIASAIGLLTAIMILPGWGENWGTTRYLSEGFHSVFVSACDACKSVIGR